MKEGISFPIFLKTDELSRISQVGRDTKKALCLGYLFFFQRFVIFSILLSKNQPKLKKARAKLLLPGSLITSLIWLLKG